MNSFDIQPFIGTLPIRFGAPRSRVLEIMGPPDVTGGNSDSWGPGLEINIGYSDDGMVDHIGFRPGEFELTLNGKTIWTPTVHPDPNLSFLMLDQEPLEHVGFLVFTKLGIKTTGYQDDDPNEFALALFPSGAWDKFLPRAKKPNLEKYEHFSSGKK